MSAHASILRVYENVPNRNIMVVSKFGACYTIGRLAFVTFSVSWELFNVVLLVVKAISFKGQERKASAHQFHDGAAIIV